MSRESPRSSNLPEFPYSLITASRKSRPTPTSDSLSFSPRLPLPVPISESSPQRRRGQQTQGLPSTQEEKGEEEEGLEEEQQQQQQEVGEAPSEEGDPTQKPRPCRRRHLCQLRTCIRKMGNHLASALGCCLPDSSLSLCKDGSSSDGSPALRTWCHTSEYPPELIRSVIENNVLFGHFSIE